MAEELAFSLPTHPPPPPPSHPPTSLYITPVILQGLQKLSQKPAVNTVQQSYSYETLAVRLLYLYSKSGMATM